MVLAGQRPGHYLQVMNVASPLIPIFARRARASVRVIVGLSVLYTTPACIDDAAQATVAESSSPGSAIEKSAQTSSLGGAVGEGCDGFRWLCQEGLECMRSESDSCGFVSCAGICTLPVAKVVTLGDSFSAGFGNPVYDCENGSNAKHCPKHVKQRSGAGCYASPEAYGPYLAAERKAESWHLACWGDRTTDVIRDQVPLIPAGTSHVLLTVGGNDLGFSTIAERCVSTTSVEVPTLFNESCRFELDALIQGRKPALRERLRETYEAIRQRLSEVSPSATVVVLGYPRLFSTDYSKGCDFPITGSWLVESVDAEDRRWANAQVDALNAMIARAVRTISREAGATAPSFVYVPTAEAFDDHGMCAPWLGRWLHTPKANLFEIAGSFQRGDGLSGAAARDIKRALHPTWFGHVALMGLVKDALFNPPPAPDVEAEPPLLAFKVDAKPDPESAHEYRLHAQALRIDEKGRPVAYDGPATIDYTWDVDADGNADDADGGFAVGRYVMPGTHAGYLTAVATLNDVVIATGHSEFRVGIPNDGVRIRIGGRSPWTVEGALLNSTLRLNEFKNGLGLEFIQGGGTVRGKDADYVVEFDLRYVALGKLSGDIRVMRVPSDGSANQTRSFKMSREPVYPRVARTELARSRLLRPAFENGARGNYRPFLGPEVSWEVLSAHSTASIALPPEELQKPVDE